MMEENKDITANEQDKGLSIKTIELVWGKEAERLRKNDSIVAWMRRDLKEAEEKQKIGESHSRSVIRLTNSIKEVEIDSSKSYPMLERAITHANIMLLAFVQSSTKEYELPGELFKTIAKIIDSVRRHAEIVLEERLNMPTRDIEFLLAIIDAIGREIMGFPTKEKRKEIWEFAKRGLICVKSFNICTCNTDSINNGDHDGRK